MEPLVPLDWALTYFAESRPKAEEWESADDTVRQRYLNWASALIKSAFAWNSGVVLEEDERVRRAVCEQALWLMRREDEYPDALTNGISSASVGGAVSATFSKDFVAPLICEAAMLAVSEAGSFIGKTARIQTMPLGW